MGGQKKIKQPGRILLIKYLDTLDYTVYTLCQFLPPVLCYQETLKPTSSKNKIKVIVKKLQYSVHLKKKIY